MSRKLNVQELESRIAPSTGLATFLSNLANSDSQMAALVSQYVNANGQVDVNGAASAWNAAGLGSKVTPFAGSFTVSDKTVLSDKTIANIMRLLGK